MNRINQIRNEAKPKSPAAGALSRTSTTDRARRAGLDPAFGDKPNVRQSMAALHRWLQPVLTWMTGKPLTDQEPFFAAGPGIHVILTFLRFGLGIVLAWVGVGLPLLWAIPVILVGWVLTVGAARTMVDCLLHEAAHNRLFTNSPVLNDLIGDTCSVLTLTRSLSIYRPDHLKHHCSLAEPVDEDIRFLVAIGFKPGQSHRWYWGKLVRELLSPIFHLRVLALRIRANLITCGPIRRLAAIGWWGTILALVGFMNQWTRLALSVGVPLIFGVQAVSLVYVLTEHRWVRVDVKRATRKVVLARLTSGRFLGRRYPSRSAEGLVAVALWWLSVPLWILQRLVIWPADAPAHDWHHREPLSRDWTRATFARRDQSANLQESEPPYTDIWGVTAAISATFSLFGCLPADASLGEPLTDAEVDDNLLNL